MSIFDTVLYHHDYEYNSTVIDVDIVEVSYISLYDWEYINLAKCRRWMERNWTLSIWASLGYIVLIFLGQEWMRNREPFKLRKVLVAWNLMLAAFSIFGFLRTVPELMYINTTHGVHFSICERHHHNYATAFWGWMMAWSKMVELGDTAFIVLRKQPLIFLHWYHHISVLVYTWVNYIDYDPPLRYFMTINLFVHGLMYSYYALKAMQIKVPRNLAMMITCLQLSQMVVGVSINLYSLWVKAVKGEHCDRIYDGIYTAFGMYASYFVLFAHFFHRAYFANKKKLA